ncbi:hypothetical protein HDU76_006108 [Blyttiomyces sp. JEL0837]|nr:hypothetical protein HDU76_006108 [Blyttiomyces sp. JEL0837]
MEDHHTDIETASQFSESTNATNPNLASGSVATPLSLGGSGQIFTCLACHVAFRSAEHQRDHYRSDWHRYNLKRKVAELPPVSQENFVERVAAQQQKATEDSAKSSFSATCEACSKTYSSENAYGNHLTSKKHKESQALWEKRQADLSKAIPNSKQETAIKIEGSTSSSTAPSINRPTNWRIQLAQAKTEQELNQLLDKKIAEAPRLTHNDCLFCNHVSESLDDTIAHMAVAHSFFIPDLEYIVDLPGLIGYLGEKISVGNVCIYCNGKGKAMHSLEAVRAHMLDRGHCKMAYEDGNEEEYGDYYDFSSTWADEDGEWEDEENEDGTVSVASSLRPRAEPAYLSEDGSQLTLPSGRTVVHRNVHQPRYTGPKTPMHDSLIITRVAGRYAEMNAVAIRSKLAAITLEKEARKQNREVERGYREFRTRTGINQNRGYSNRFFRDQTGFT